MTQLFQQQKSELIRDLRAEMKAELVTDLRAEMKEILQAEMSLPCFAQAVRAYLRLCSSVRAVRKRAFREQGGRKDCRSTLVAMGDHKQRLLSQVDYGGCAVSGHMPQALCFHHAFTMLAMCLLFGCLDLGWLRSTRLPAPWAWRWET